jgi:hypothetical protein
MTDTAPAPAAARGADPAPLAPAVRNAIFGAVGYACGYNAITLTLFSGNTDFFFPWVTSALTAATLGAVYAGALAMCLVAVRATRWTSVRATIAPTALSLVLVAAAGVAEHRSLRLTGGPVVAFVGSYIWFLIHAALIVCVAVALWHQRRLRHRASPADRLMRRHGPGRAALRMPRTLRAPLVTCGIVALAAGGALWLRPGDAGWWPWRLAPVDARVLGGWAIAYGLGVLLSVREADLWRIAPGLAMVAVISVLAVAALIRYPAGVSWTGAAAYLGVLLVTGLTGALGLITGGPWRSRSV